MTPKQRRFVDQMQARAAELVEQARQRSAPKIEAIRRRVDARRAALGLPSMTEGPRRNKRSTRPAGKEPVKT